jgi:hypothetical protein
VVPFDNLLDWSLRLDLACLATVAQCCRLSAYLVSIPDLVPAGFVHELFTPAVHVAASRRQLLGCAGPVPAHNLGI